MFKADRDSVLAIVASLLVLFSALVNPVLTIALVVMILVAMAIFKVVGRARPKG